MARQKPSIFRGSPPTISLPAFDYSAGYIDSIKDINIPENALSGGQNMIVNLSGKPAKRGGNSLYNNFISAVTGILGLFNVVDRAGTVERLAVQDTSVLRDVTSTWTALTGVTMTTNLPADGAYMPLTNKFYIINGTDNVVKYTTGSGAGDQTDDAFKKGKYIMQFQNRLLVSGVSAQEDYIWYTDRGLDTFSSNNYFRVVGQVTGLIEYYDKALIFTKRKIHRLQNFTFSGTAAGPEAVIPLPVDFGSIYEPTIKVVNNYVYFLGQDSRKKVELYKCDGYQAVPVGDPKIRNWLNSLSTAQLGSACAITDGVHYRIQVADSGFTTNTTGMLYDTVRDIFYLPEKRFVTGVNDYSCFMVSEASGQFEVYGGTQTLGQVYKLNQTTSYDELPEERYLTLGTYNVPIDANPAKRAAQSFKMHNYNTSQTVAITQLALYLAKNTGTTTQLTVRIETDNNGKPSGTLVTNASTTITALTSTNFSWQQAKFSTAPVLTGNTTYWIVIQHTTEGTGSSKCYWLGNACTATYTYGNLATYATQVASTDTFNSSAAAVDGQATRNNFATTGVGESFSSLINGAGTSGSSILSNLTMDFTSDTTTNLYQILQRGILMFDTSAIPDTATITSASLKLYCTDKTDSFGMALGLTSAAPASNTVIVAADYAFANFGSTRFATDFNINSLTLNAYNTWTLNASGLAAISKTGVSKFGLRFSVDIDQTAPTWQSEGEAAATFQTVENTNKPQLVVTYTIGSGTATWVADAITDQAFIVYAESPIDGYFDTKAFSPTKVLSPLTQLNEIPTTLSQRVLLQKFYALFSTVGNYNVQIGFTNGDFDSFKYFLFNLADSSTTNTWGGGGKWGGGGTWGGTQARIGAWTQVSSFTGRIVKVRVRNSGANQPFTFDGMEIVVTPKYRQR